MHPFQNMSLFKQLPKFESVNFSGELLPKVLNFNCIREGNPIDVLLAQIISKYEADIWKSFQDLLTRSMKDTAAIIRGFFSFDVLSVDLGDGIQQFDWNAFISLIVNHAQKMEVGEERYIHFACIFVKFRKKIPESYGKIDCSFPVQVYNQEVSKLDLFLKKIINKTNEDSSSIIVLHDLSREGVFRFGDETQTDRLRKLLTQVKETHESDPPELLVIQKGIVISLWEQFDLV